MSRSYSSGDAVFAGAAFSGNTDAPIFDNLDGDVSSFIITGQSPWTFFTGIEYTGASLCVYPDRDYTNADGMTMDTFSIHWIELMGLADNSLRSVKKGCWGTFVVKSSSLEHASQNEEDMGKRIIASRSHGKLRRAADKN